MATTLPMKKPTAMLLWNLRMIMVPPIPSAQSMSADQMAANPSASGRVVMTAKLIMAKTNVRVRIEYLLIGRNVDRIQSVRSVSWTNERTNERTNGRYRVGRV